MIHDEQHVEWHVNIIQIFIDFQELNAACFKDKFPLLITYV